MLSKIDPTQRFETLKLCSIRTTDDVVMVAVRPINGQEYEITLTDIINSDAYEGLQISRKYSSGHVFLSQDESQVYLLTVENKGIQQQQFTGGSPQEEQLKSVYINDNGIIKLNLEKIEENAVLRTKIRTGVEVMESYNETPLVDWVLNERYNEQTGQHDRSLVLLLHYVVKSYIGKLSYNTTEYVVDGERYNIDEINSLPRIGQNILPIIHKSLEIVKQ